MKESSVSQWPGQWVTMVSKVAFPFLFILSFLATGPNRGRARPWFNPLISHKPRYSESFHKNMDSKLRNQESGR